MSEEHRRGGVTRPGQHASPGASRLLLVSAAILLLSLTLRAPTTAVGPVLTAIGDMTGWNPTVLSLLTSVPLLCFVAVAPLVPVLLRRVSLDGLIGWALLGASLGVVVRSLPGGGLIWVGTVLLGIAVAVASVLAPAVVRAARYGGSGVVMALYTAGLSLGPALAAGLTLPLGELLGGGWRAALGVWAVLPLLALACWRVAAGRGGAADRSAPPAPTPDTAAGGSGRVWGDTSASGSRGVQGDTAARGVRGGTAASGSRRVRGETSAGGSRRVWGGTAAGGSRCVRDTATGGSRRVRSDTAATGSRRVWGEPAAWLLTAYLGLTSLLFYTTAAWLPAILESGGATPTTAGMVTALAGFVAVPASFLAPLAARRPPTTRALAVLAPTPIAVGLVVIAAAPEMRVLGAALIGVGQGASVGIAYALIIVSARTTQHAAALSSMSQTVGVSLAALGPFAFAATQEALGSWAGAAAMLAVVPVLQALIALARPTPGTRRVPQEHEPRRPR